jgi:predicted nucleic-acid-binding Zn-ribbon protein
MIVEEMEKGARITGYLTIAVRFTKMSDLKGDMIIPYYCKNCGFIELYKEMIE